LPTDGSTIGREQVEPALAAAAPRGLTRIKDNARRRAPNFNDSRVQEVVMLALRELFTTDVGLMSAAGIAFMLGMAVFFIRYFLRHMKEDELRAKAGKL
jgi:hypothetical protein